MQVAVCDEIASHKTTEVYDVLLTAMGKRRHPLLLSIRPQPATTRGSASSSGTMPCACWKARRRTTGCSR